MSQDMLETMTVWALMATPLVNLLVGLLRMAFVPPRWLPPLLALLAGIGVVILLMVASGEALTPARLATAALAGTLAGASAVGVKEVMVRERKRP